MHILFHNLYKVFFFLLVFLFSYSLAYASPADDFVFTWEVKKSQDTMGIPINTDNVFFTVDWGDGSPISEPNTKSHVYENSGIYEVRIIGSFPSINFEMQKEASQLLSIEQWGSNKWHTMKNAFHGAHRMVINAKDAPNLFRVRSMESAFFDTKAMNQSLNHWDVSNVENMQGTFYRSGMNQPIDQWDTWKVNTMLAMFDQSQFTQDISMLNFSGIFDKNNLPNEINAETVQLKYLTPEYTTPHECIPSYSRTDITVPAQILDGLERGSSEYYAVARLAQRGIVQGDGVTGTANVDGLVQRDQLIKMISVLRGFRIKDPQKCTIDLPFSDTDKNAWYAPHLEYATQKGIISGYSDGTFRPANSITKAELYKIIAIGIYYTTEERAVSQALQQNQAWFEPYLQEVEMRLDLTDEILSLPLDAQMTRKNTFIMLDMANELAKMQKVY
jgi:hypothetical protein